MKTTTLKDLKDEFSYHRSLIKSHPVDDAKTLYLKGEDVSIDRFDNIVHNLKTWIEPKEKLEDLI